MDGSEQFTRMERILQDKITQISLIKSMLLAEIEAVHQREPIGRKIVLKGCIELIKNIEIVRNVLHSLRQEIMCLPAILGEETGVLLLKIKQSIVNQWSQHRLEVDKLKGEISAKGSQNRILQQRITELQQRYQQFDLKREECQTPLQQHYSYTVDDNSQSPAIEYPAFKLEPIIGEIVPLVNENQFIKSKIKIRESSESQNILRTQPAVEDSNAFSFSERAVSYRKIDSRQRTKNFISDFRNVVEVTNVVKHGNPFDRVADFTLSEIQNKIGSSKPTTPDIFMHRPSFSRIELIKNHNCQQNKKSTEISSQQSKEPQIIELGRARRSISKDARKQFKENIQIVNKDRPMSSKDCNVPLARPSSKQKIRLTMKSNELNSCKRNSKCSVDTSILTKTKFNYVQFQAELEKIDVYLGDRRTQQRYDGCKNDQVRCGKGRLQYINGLIYDGDFKDNMRHGQGILSLNGKTIYEGEWQRDRLCGRGLLRNIYLINKRRLEESSYIRYCIYDGYFENNRFQGQGTLVLSNGNRFVSQFHNGMICGNYSLFNNQTGQKQTGIF